MKKFLASLFLVGLAVIPANAAVTATFQRIGHTDSKPTTLAIVMANLSGTYATGGFVWTPGAISGAPGSSPLAQRNLRAAQWISPNGYIYATTFANGTATTKIFSAASTELTNGAAVPDATAILIEYLSQ